MSKRSSAITTKQTTQAALMKKLERDPGRYRVGATVDVGARMSSYNTQSKYRGKTAYVAPSKIPDVKEDRMLQMLPGNHRHNDQKHSNHPGDAGYVYLIDTKK